jgi:myosin-crossreactive antigen
MQQHNGHSEYQAGASGRKVYLVGDGIPYLAAAAFLIRDTDVENCLRFEFLTFGSRVTPRPGVF